MELSKVLVGEYVFANGISSVGINENNTKKVNAKIYPNPSDSLLKIETKKLRADVSYFIFSANGSLVHQGIIAKHSGKSIHEINTESFASGAYIISFNGSSTQTFIVEH